MCGAEHATYRCCSKKQGSNEAVASTSWASCRRRDAGGTIDNRCGCACYGGCTQNHFKHVTEHRHPYIVLFELSEATVKYFVLAASNIGNRSDDSRIDSRDEDKEGEVDQDEDDHDGSGDGSGMGEDAGDLQDRESQA